VALRFGETHSLGIGVALGSQPIGLYLRAFALLFEQGKLADIDYKAASRKRGGDTR
jgi:hypothetical protein